MMNRMIQPRTFLLALLCLAVLAWTGIAAAQLPPPGTPWQFDVTGFIQAATLGGTGCAAAPVTGALACGTITVNGHVIVVPSNTIVTLPANQLTWEELFTQAPQPYLGLGLSGLAQSDVPAPLTPYEAHVVGNVVPAATPGQGTYVAGLVSISQQSLNSGSGYITSIASVATSAFEAVPSSTGFEIELQIATDAGGLAKVRINDPLAAGLTTGRYSIGQSPDKRFTSDPDNPTITAATGFPMCLYGADTAVCPQGNRPILPTVPPSFAGSFTTVTGNCVTFPNPCTFDASGNAIRIGPGTFPDATLQAPFEVGDYVTFSGNLVQDCNVTGCAAGGPTALGTVAFPTLAGSTYISAHTITNNIAIWTAGRTLVDPAPKDPAYARIDVSLLGTGGLIIFGVNEAAIRTRFEGFITDATRSAHLYGIDTGIPPTTATSDRDWGTIGADPGKPLGVVQGRWRFRPPCAPFGTVEPTKTFDKQCVMNQAGTFLPPTREVKVTVEVPACPAGGFDPILGYACPAIGASAVPAQQLVTANGLTSGQYHAPIADYIFPEQVIGNPVPPANFETIPFLAQGGYISTLGTQATGALNPWPGAGFVAPAPVCNPPVAAAGGPYQAASNGTVTLAGTVGGTNATFSWSAPTLGTLTPLTGSLTPTYTAGLGPATDSTTLTVSACNATATSIATINVNAPAAPTVSYVPVSPVTVLSGVTTTITATGVDPNGLKVDVSWTQTAGTPVVVSPNPLVCKGTSSTTTCVLSINVSLPVGAPSATLTLSALATNSAGVSSAPDATTVTVLPTSDTLSITSAEYRTGKKRLIVNVTDTTISPGAVVTLLPYPCSAQAIPCAPNASGVWMYNPDPAVGGLGNLFTNNGGGLYLLDISGAPPPACHAVPDPTGIAYTTPCAVPAISVKSAFGGTAFSPLTRIRQ
jgi:hypothetical protein